ncbi:MAG TPA: DUF2059 domain-containing protein, partial [Pyrinomonadaceae bacterium]|nr:DUF2059 domain-containing protein [Pyrinomonadaceae bacterium]
KDFRARGLFEKMPPEQAARMERLIKEFSANVFSEIKSRVGRDLNTPESFDPLAVPVFDKYFTLEELNALTAAFQTPAGRKLVEAYPRLMAEATVAALEARGFFDVPPSPEAQEAKMDKFLAELRADPSALYRDVLAAGEREAPKHFDEADAKEWAAFAQTPLGRKLAGESPRFLGELTQNFFLLNGPRVGPLVQEIYQAELEKFAEKLGAAERDGPPPTPRRRTTNRRANRRP